MTRDVDINQNKPHLLMTWFSTEELLGVGGLPASRAGIYKQAITTNWIKRQRSNTKGVTFEYHISSLPQLTQIALQRLWLEKDCTVMPILWEMSDDTMNPTISKHQQLALSEQSTFKGEGIYLIKQNTNLNVRRVKWKETSQQYLLICDNPLYQQEQCSTLCIIAKINHALHSR